jgi:L-fuculose-phosphate aldolase
MIDANALREEICRIGRLLFQFNFISGTGGNISARLDDGDFLITPTKVNKGFLSSESIIRIGLDCTAKEGEGRPSSEKLMHVGLYCRLGEAKAVIHAHPVYATAFAIRGEAIKTYYSPEAMVFLGAEVPLVEYATPSTQTMADGLAKHLSPGISSYLLQNHGVVVWGRSLQDAFNNLQTLELYAKQLTVANLTGGAKPIPQWKIDEMKRVFDLE